MVPNIVLCTVLYYKVFIFFTLMGLQLANMLFSDLGIYSINEAQPGA